MLSDVDYRNKVVVTDSIVLIALDTYLGAEHEFYASFYDYIKQNLNKDQIVSDLATAYAEQLIYQPKRATFLEEMIYFGKQLYLKDLLIPFKENNEKIGYLPRNMNGLKRMSFIYGSTLLKRNCCMKRIGNYCHGLLYPLLFLRFNLELDSESPGRLGQYMGWQIVKSYMENNETPLLQMLQMEATRFLTTQNLNQKNNGTYPYFKDRNDRRIRRKSRARKFILDGSRWGVANEEAKAMMLSVWDQKKQETLRIDLWTKDMPVDEMKLFFHQTLVTMSDTYLRATQDEKMTATMKDFCDYFAEKLELVKK